MAEASIHDVTRQIRDFINHPRIRFALMKDLSRWFQVCVSLDLLGDTDMAVQAYMTASGNEPLPRKYLNLFGVLQAVYVQQDAAKSLRMALGFHLQFSEHRELLEARNLRNDIVGHPTNRNQGESFHAVSQITLRHDSLQLVSSYAHGTTEFRSVDILDGVQKHYQRVVLILQGTIDELRAQDMEHKKRVADSRLTDILPANYQYYLGVLSQATGESVDSIQAATAPAGLAVIKEGLAKLPRLLEGRGLSVETYDAVAFSFKWCNFAVEKLNDFLENGTLDPQSAYVFVTFLGAQLRELLQVLAEIDSDYALAEGDS